METRSFVRSERSGYPEASAPPQTAVRDLARHVARCFRASLTTVLAPGRANARDTLARHVAMYAAHVTLSRSYAEIAAIFACHRTSVRYACARIEAMRDDPRFDRRMCRLEAWISGENG